MESVTVFSQVRWQLTVGDPTLLGWTTFAAFLFAAALAVLASRAQSAAVDAPGERRREARVWRSVAIALGLLGLNKQMDLQSLLTDIGRLVARQQGWYSQRRAVQAWLVIGALVGAGALGCWLGWRHARFWKSHKLLVTGSLLLLAFVAVRAMSFHHADVMLGRRLFGFKASWVLELAGILLISLAAAREYALRKVESGRRDGTETQSTR